MTAPQAWRIYHHDAMNKTELTSSPSRVKKAREAGLTVVELMEKPEHPYAVLTREIGESGFFDYKPVKPNSINHLHARQNPHYDYVELYAL